MQYRQLTMMTIGSDNDDVDNEDADDDNIDCDNLYVVYDDDD